MRATLLLLIAALLLAAAAAQETGPISVQDFYSATVRSG